ncbi:MAG TPA: WbqC family protein [Candidatus Limnocylindrales bacterium]|nr:WbqC family protein [Candidatus Limnocylindrales bacterium]
MSTNCVILQPSYIPWRGFFHQMQKADVFIFYDDVQFDRHGWRNRNRIKTPQGGKWLTIPVHSRGHLIEHTPIHKIEVSWNDNWSRKHWLTLQQYYGRAPHFERYREWLERFYGRRDALLADFTIDLTIQIASELGLHHTRFVRSSTLEATGVKTDRLLNILAKVKATHYISGPSARAYLEADKFAAAGITLEYMTYDYPEYSQLYPPFDPQVSILDLLFMTGPDAPRYIWDRATGK